MKNLKEKIIEQIAPKLRALRIERRLTLHEIAGRTDLSVNTVGNIELGNNVSFDKYQKLIRFYGKRLEIELR